ncbi:hypothetical protein [Mesorhizobium sp. CAU 1732]|uniref:hypothetical protein n=1 Tax=Mesorhizobium sp. CAU 1732 TaxID=3140358 RepID=UPI003260056C
MSAILPFVIRPRVPAMVRPAGSAAIIIFPGVRYEKNREMEDRHPPKASDGVQRKRKSKSR